MAEEVDQSRRRFLTRLSVGAVSVAGWTAGGWLLAGAGQAEAVPCLRPPGALPESKFLSVCIRCGRCADACPNNCIEFLPLGSGLADALTPVINPRVRGCTLCMECTHVCPTGALTAIAPHGDDIEDDLFIAEIEMGVARVNRDMCYSFAGRTCGACYRACPLQGRAMRIGLYETPLVNREECVGCGLCEQACIHLPQAIRVLPVERQRGVS